MGMESGGRGKIRHATALQTEQRGLSGQAQTTTIKKQVRSWMLASA